MATATVLVKVEARSDEDLAEALELLEGDVFARWELAPEATCTVLEVPATANVQRPWRAGFRDPSGTGHAVPCASFSDALAEVERLAAAPHRRRFRVWKARPGGSRLATR